jgi:hypothetical protein
MDLTMMISELRSERDDIDQSICNLTHNTRPIARLRVPRPNWTPRSESTASLRLLLASQLRVCRAAADLMMTKYYAGELKRAFRESGAANRNAKLRRGEQF